MKNILLLFTVMISVTGFSKTIIVNDQNDKRLLAFTDSMECYKFGIWQQENIKKVKSPDDGRAFYLQALEYQKQIGSKYVTRAISLGDAVFLFADSKGSYGWRVAYFKKPVDTVIYKSESAVTYIWMPSGAKMSKDDFIERYGKEVYDRIVKPN